jgi:predicted cupin superfamily sugar epimerase
VPEGLKKGMKTFLLLFFVSFANAQTMTPQQVIETLGLEPLPQEGGFYKQNYKCLKNFKINGKSRAQYTAIYYMVTHDSFSALHKLEHDEIFHFYDGETVEMLQIFPDGHHKIIKIGNNLNSGEIPQVLVPAGVWQGTRMLKPTKDKYSLLGTTMAPGFEYDDFTMGERAQMINEFPQLRELIYKFTR